MMRVWVFCFVLLFGAAELYQWVKDFRIPLPIFILGGAFLAIASNYEKRVGFPFHLPFSLDRDDVAELGDRPPIDIPVNRAQPSDRRPADWNYPPSVSSPPPNRPISFTIRKPD